MGTGAPSPKPDVCAPIDANGNLTADGTRTFEWDARSRLVASQAGNQRTELQYDGFGRRRKVVESLSGVIQRDGSHLWCDGDVCEERVAGASTINRQFTSSEHFNGADQFLFKDHLGSVRSVTASSGLLAQYGFDPWGRRSLESGADSTRIGFTGHVLEPVSQLWLSLYRPLSADQGRWITEDPLGWAAGPNQFAYVDGRPTVSRDPLGLSPVVFWWLGRALLVWGAIEMASWCIDGVRCGGLIGKCKRESTDCANKLAMNIMSPLYHDRIRFCFVTNSSCQTMWATCGRWALFAPPFPEKPRL